MKGNLIQPTDLIIGQKYYIEYTVKEWGNSPIIHNWNHIHTYIYDALERKNVLIDTSTNDKSFLEVDRVLTGYEIGIFEWEE